VCLWDASSPAFSPNHWANDELCRWVSPKWFLNLFCFGIKKKHTTCVNKLSNCNPSYRCNFFFGTHLKRHKLHPFHLAAIICGSSDAPPITDRSEHWHTELESSCVTLWGLCNYVYPLVPIRPNPLPTSHPPTSPSLRIRSLSTCRFWPPGWCFTLRPARSTCMRLYAWLDSVAD